MSDRDVVEALGGAKRPLELVRAPFALHRAINEALRDADVEVLRIGDPARQALVLDTVARGWKDDKRWRERVHPDDHAINVEGMTFAADGSLLLGLRTPVSADGNPLIVALPDPDALFDAPDEVPRCGPVWEVRCGGTLERPLGIRGMHTAADGITHLIVGNLDAEGKDSVLLESLEGGSAAECEHWHLTGLLPETGGAVDAVRMHVLDGLKTVEGIAQTPDGDFVYVVDRDHNVHLRFLLTATDG
jgi:hypothetical protein